MSASPKNISDLLNKIGVKEMPVVVPVRPENYAQLQECYFNVLEKVRRDGGKLHCGWHLHTKSRFIVEAERHAVWEDSNGNLIDITPSQYREDSILFVSDKTDDIDLCMRTDNVRMNITDNKVVNDFIDVCETISKISFLFPRSHNLETYTTEGLMEIQDTYIKLRDYLFTYLYYGGNENTQCFCGSGKTYRYCHGMSSYHISPDELHYLSTFISFE